MKSSIFCDTRLTVRLFNLCKELNDIMADVAQTHAFCEYADELEQQDLESRVQKINLNQPIVNDIASMAEDLSQYYDKIIDRIEKFEATRHTSGNE